jgi:RNA polymerase sigma-70 factor (ECF subfamily)
VRRPRRGDRDRLEAPDRAVRNDRGATFLDGLTDAIAAVYADEWGRIVATLIRLTGDWDLAEECAQDAFAQALERWPRDGVPLRPGGWLTTTARNRAVDRLRRTAVESGKLRELALVRVGDSDQQADRDDRLELMFSCCHPALALDAQVALTLRSLAGLRTAEIARAFRVSERTMGQRIFRAKDKIRHAGIPFRVPSPDRLPERTTAVLAVLYLLFNEGYAATEGADLLRQSLSTEAIRLTRLLATLLPCSPETHGLLALMLFHDARRAARVDEAGQLVPLEEQDRSGWKHDEIDDAVEILDAALQCRRPGPYQVQAAIAACHATASGVGTTDWTQIVLLYDQLMRYAPNPVVELNRAVAVAMADGPAAGLAIVETLSGNDVLAGYHLLTATRADLLRRLGRNAEAAVAYRDAMALANTDAERWYLARRCAALLAGEC